MVGTKKLIQYFLLCLFLIPLLWFGKAVCQNVTFFDVLWIFQNKSWKAKFKILRSFGFQKKNVQAYLGFQKEFLSSNDEVALDTPPQSRRRGFAKNQWQHKTIIQKESLLKLSSTFWVSDIKAKKHHTKLENLISCILCEREKNFQLADGRWHMQMLEVFHTYIFL